MRMTLTEANEYRKVAERANMLFVRAERGYPYLEAVAVQVTARAWRAIGHAIQYLVERDDLITEVESALLGIVKGTGKTTWEAAQDLPTDEAAKYLYTAARQHLKAYLQDLIDYDAATTQLVVERGGDAFDVADWLGHGEPSAETAALRGVREPNYDYRAALAVSGDFIRALQAEQHGDLAIRWLEGTDIKVLAAQEGTSARTIQNRLFGYLPSAAGRVKDPRGALEKAAEAAPLQGFEPTADGYAELRAAWKV